jgi:polyisoprenoid-binding protein YceI
MRSLAIFLGGVVIVGGILMLTNKADSPIVVDENVPTAGTGDEMPSNPDANGGVDSSFNGSKDLDTTKSEATWTGSKTLIKDYYDKGTLSIKSGTAVFASGMLIGGEVVFDMTSIATTSTGKGDDADTTSKMAGHLKSPDFFDATAFPDAKFVIKSAAKESDNTYIVTGDLTIKGKTNSESFPIEVTTLNGVATISGTATIDRTVYDVKFGSGKFFTDLGDNVINDEFTLEFKAVTK